MSLREHGLTMVELLVSLFVFAVLMAGLGQLVETNSRNATASGSLAKIADTGRTAIQLLTTDIRRAGYMGGNIDTQMIDNNLITGTLGVAPTADACDPNTTAWAHMVGQPIFGLNDTNAGYACIEDDEYDQGDVLTLRYAVAPPIDVTVDEVEDFQPYFRSTMLDGRLFFGKDMANSDNDLSDPAARDFALAAHTYFVGPTGRQCRGRDTPALFRKAIDDQSGLPVTQELLTGVENIQFRYLVNNRYYNAADVPDWLGVEAVETTILVRTECPEVGYIDDRTYNMADIEYTPDVDERDFRRQIFTVTTQLRN